LLLLGNPIIHYDDDVNFDGFNNDEKEMGDSVDVGLIKEFR